MAEEQRKAELSTVLARSRGEITTNVHALGHDLDFVSRARRAFKTHPAVWIGSALLVGLLISRLPFGRKKVVVAPRAKKTEETIEKVEKTGLLLAVLKIAFNVLKPTLMGWATRRVAEYFEEGNRRNYGGR